MGPPQVDAPRGHRDCIRPPYPLHSLKAPGCQEPQAAAALAYARYSLTFALAYVPLPKLASKIAVLLLECIPFL